MITEWILHNSRLLKLEIFGGFVLPLYCYEFDVCSCPEAGFPPSN